MKPKYKDRPYSVQAYPLLLSLPLKIQTTPQLVLVMLLKDYLGKYSKYSN